MRIAAFMDDFKEVYEKEPRKVIVWGAGRGLRERWAELTHVDIICDINAKEINEINGVRVVGLDEIEKIKEKIYIIVSVRNKDVFYSICTMIENYHLDALVFHLFDNIAWGYSYGKTAESYTVINSKETLKVNIVTLEKTWIFKKFADNLQRHLQMMGVEATVSSETREDVDINHHIPYDEFVPYCNDTLMITHVDNMKKLEMLKKQFKVVKMGICMSKETMNTLIAYGIPRNKLCYINPAQDNKMPIHKYTIGITHRCYDDVDMRKRATAIIDVLDGVNPEFFRFIIMGAGWEKIVEEMLQRSFEVEYFNEFHYDKYTEIMQKIDYYMYMGFDEGSMGYLDALAAGVGTIVTPQGYHLDVDVDIDYPCSTVRQFREALLDLQAKREKRTMAVREWTWENYALKHMEVWNYILQRKGLKELFAKSICYSDGIYSVYVDDNRLVR